MGFQMAAGPRVDLHDSATGLLNSLRILQGRLITFDDGNRQLVTEIAYRPLKNRRLTSSGRTHEIQRLYFATCKPATIAVGKSVVPREHSFMQLLHQGTRLVPVDFILSASSELATANCRAQASALMMGTTDEDLEPYRVHVGNRPSSTIHYDELTPEVLGQLIALYEHKVFVEGVIWGIDSFDQWGVELGKKLAAS